MPDNIKIGPNVIVAAVDADIEAAGVLFPNTKVIYTFEDGLIKRFRPGLGSFNNFTQFKSGQAYYFEAKQGFYLPGIFDFFATAPYQITLQADFNRIISTIIDFNPGTEKYEVLGDIDFQEADIGKILCIERGRSFPEYGAQPITLNARIIGINESRAVIEQLDKDNSGNFTGSIIESSEEKPAFCATDNWQALQDGINYCAANNINKLYLNHVGTAYINPTLHNNALFAANQYANKVNSDLIITGRSKLQTGLKYGPEDIQNFGSKMINYSAFVVGNCTLHLENLTLRSAERVSTRVEHQLVQAITSIPLNTDTVSNQNIFCDNVDIVSVDPLLCQGWGGAIYMNNSSLVDGIQVQEFKNGTIKAQAGPSFYNAQTGNQAKDNAGRVQRVNNAVIYAGARYCRQVIGKVKVTAGSDLIEVLDTPDWSWYDFQNYIDEGTDVIKIFFQIVLAPVDISYPYTGPTVQATLEPSAKILNTNEALFCQLVEVISPTVCRIKTSGNYTAPSAPRPNLNYQLPVFSTTTASLYTCETEDIRAAAFHATYVSGTVASQLIDVDAHALRYIRNRQNVYQQPAIADIVDNVEGVRDISYPAAEALRFLYIGNGYGRNVQELGIV